MTATASEEMLAAGAAARRLGISREWLRQLADANKVRFAVTPYGRVYDPRDIERLAAAALQLTNGRPYLLRVGVRHDDECPCLAGRSMRACTCEIVHLEAKRVA